MWPVKCDMGSMTCEIWNVKKGHMKCENVTSEMWQMKCEIRNVT